MKINILGTEYTIETRKIAEDKKLEQNQWSGYCNNQSKLIVVLDVVNCDCIDLEKEEAEIYKKEILRHEIIHAFLNESGLDSSSYISKEGWATNEEMVDWIAIQFPKILQAFEKAGAL